MKKYHRLIIVLFLFFLACEKNNEDVSLSVNLFSESNFNYRYEDFEVAYSINDKGEHQYKLKFVLLDSIESIKYRSDIFDTIFFNSHFTNSDNLKSISWFQGTHEIEFYNLENHNYFIQLHIIDYNSESVISKSNLFPIEINKKHSDTSRLENFILTDIEGNNYELVKILESKNYIFLFYFATWCGWSKKSIPVVQYIDSVYTEEISTFGIEGSISNDSQISKISKFINDYGIDYPVCLLMKNANIENVLPLHTTSFPNFLLIDNKRRLIYKQIGYSDILIDSVAFYLRSP